MPLNGVDLAQLVKPGIVSLRILSNICTRSLFSLTPNVIGRYRIFNSSMLTPAVISKRDSSNETGYEKSAYVNRSAAHIAVIHYTQYYCTF
ncbi:hypothetical protein T06_16520 [Trichinella sp. T6]|nr:hypothetical protein T06_16520 [Trichinella sp. T6]